MDKPNVIKKELVKAIRRCRKTACYGNANVTSVMAVDSHADNHYELAIDNVNNNNSTKKNFHRHSIIKLESRDDDYCLDSVDDDSAGDESTQKGSGRRKYSSISRGISIEEFLLRQDRPGQLSAIDKLILKNKTALQNSQMKQTRSKLPAANAPVIDAAATTNGKSKKEPKRKEKVLGSKIAAAKKKCGSNASTVKKTCAGVPATNKKKCGGPSQSEKNTAKAAAAAKKAETSVVIKVEETTKVKSKIEENAKVKVKSKRTSDGKKTMKKEPSAVISAPAVTVTSSKKSKADVDSKQATKIKKRVKKNEQLPDARGFKQNVSPKTRSSTKVVKLRNGKSRIVSDNKKTASPSPQPRKNNRRSGANITLDNSATSEILANGSKPSPAFKRNIKQEPREEDSGVKRKRRKITDKIETSPTPVTPITPIVAESDLKLIPVEIAPETIPTPAQMPILTKEEAEISNTKSNPTIEETPIVPEEKLIKETPVMDEKPVTSTEMIIDEAPVIETGQLNIEPMIEEPSEPPMLSPQAPASSAPTDDVIVIDSSEDSDVTMIDSPPVIPPSVPTPTPAKDPPSVPTPAPAKDPPSVPTQASTKDPPSVPAPAPVQDPPSVPAPTPVKDLKVTEAAPAKPDEQLEDTATETSEDTGDEEFALQDANTESEDIIDEDITLQYESDDEATAADTIQELKELVESAREIITSVVEEPKVIPSQEKQPKQPDTKVQDKQENNAVKESILGALGLTSLEKVQQKAKENNYTGTLKAVIKIDKGCRRMELKSKDAGPGVEGLQNENVLSFYSKTLPSKFDQVSDSATLDKGVSEMNPVNGLDSTHKTKSHDDGLLSSLREPNVRAMETDYNGIIDPISGVTKEKTKAAASLVVPEKSSSFSIHPNRLCSDVCKYCFGKFGSLDTPCHVGQMKNPERQRKILLCEPNLKLDTCLCDACYRFVDRKANKPPQKRNKSNSMRRPISINQRTAGPCVIQNCTQFARHTVKRKWLLRISKKIAKLSFDVNKGGPRMRYGLCSQHYYLVDFYTLCGICKKRLNRNHMYSIRSELNDLNNILEEDSIPIKLVDNMLLCKLCHYYMSLRLKYGDASKMSPSNRQYYQNFRKKILIYYNVIISDSEDPITTECLKYENGTGIDSHSPENFSQGTKMIEELNASSSKPPTVTTTTTTSATCTTDSKRPLNSSSSKKNNHNVGFCDIADLLKPLEGDGDKNSSTRIQVKFGNLNIGKLSNLNIGQNSSTHQNEPKHDKSSEKDLPLIADFCFDTPSEGAKNWEKCVSTILFDKATKKLWQDLQKPYGNQSSFIRHLIMLEKYWRSGALVLAGSADAGAMKYINSVKNRVQSLETSSSPSPSPSPSSAPVPTPVAAPATPQMPTLKPATNMTVRNSSSTIHYKPSEASKTSPVEAGSSTVNVRHTPAPPPLLKIDQMNGIPFGVSNKITVSAEPKVQYQTHAPKRVTPRNAEISLQQYVEMMHPQPRTKHFSQVTNGTVKGASMAMLKKTLPTMPTMRPIHIANSISVESLTSSPAPKTVKKSASMAYHGTANFIKPKDRQYYNMNMTQSTTISTAIPGSKSVVDSSFIAKLPKALTVTQIDESMSKEKASSDKQHIPAPFLAGEKPSVSVFREITK